MGLAVALELPLVILDIQRAGPSTGMPTKPEQADLLMVMFGRSAESPVPVLAATSPGHCFEMAIEAARIALKYRTPVYLLSDAYLANGSEPWLVPDVADLPDISPQLAPSRTTASFLPTCEIRRRSPASGRPGTPGLEHRIGGLEKEERTGNISYDPDNHDLMVRIRAEKIAGIAADIPELTVDHQEGANLLVLGWGGTHGPIAAGVRSARERGVGVSQAHLAYLNPFPRNLGDVLRSYDRVLVPEMNLGQLLKLVRAEYLVDAVGYQRARGPVHLRRAGRRDRGAGMTELPVLSAKDLKTDQEVRWCPGCGDYAVLATMQSFLRSSASRGSGSSSSPGSGARPASRTT